MNNIFSIFEGFCAIVGFFTLLNIIWKKLFGEEMK